MIARKALRDSAWKAVVTALLLLAHLLIVSLYFPDFEENVEGIKRAIPVDFLKKWVDAAASRGFESYVAIQHFAKAINTFGTFAAVFFGCGAVAGEVERGTIEFLVSRPFSRRRILFTKYWIGAVALLVPIWVVTPAVFPLGQYLEHKVTPLPVLLQLVHSSCFLMVLYSLTFFLSACATDSFWVAFLVLGFSLIEFALLVVKGASHFSIYKLADWNYTLELLGRQRLPWGVDAGLLAASGVLYFLAQRKFERRDF
jgi:ABC-type transport system involved in multi-copper enzyme maturation permease subunit